MFSTILLVLNLSLALFMSRDGTSASVQDYGRILMGIFLVLSALTMLWTQADSGSGQNNWETP